MKFYADNASRRARQLVVDALACLWCVLWIAIGVYVTRSFTGAEDGARKLQSSGSSMGQHLSEIGSTIGGLPIVGGGLKDPFNSAAHAATSAGNAGHDLADGLGRLAFLLGFLTALAPILLALLPWSFVRVRYARRAGRVARLRGMPGGEKLLALEALSTASPRALRSVSDDPAGDWQHGDRTITRQLADMALGTYGLERRASARTPDDGAAHRPHRAEPAEATRRLPRTTRSRTSATGRDGRRPHDFEDDDTHWA